MESLTTQHPGCVNETEYLPALLGFLPLYGCKLGFLILFYMERGGACVWFK
jgi:hypothetical protein